MPRGDKSKYTDKQERKADHIAQGYEKRGVSGNEAERRAWATVNKDDGGGKKPGGSGRGAHTGHPAAHKGGKAGGRAAASRSAAERSASAKKAATLSAAERAGLDAFWVMRTLRINATMAMRHGDRSAANRAVELIGKHLGMFVEKKSIDISYIDDSDEYLRQLMEIVNAKVIEHEPAQLENGHEDGAEHGPDEKP